MLSEAPQSLRIIKAPEGGFLVSGDGYRDPGFMPPMLFASTTIEEALKFIKSKLTTK